MLGASPTLGYLLLFLLVWAIASVSPGPDVFRPVLRFCRRSLSQPMCEALGEFALAEQIRKILVEEQDHQIDLATALGEEVPDLSSKT